MPEEKLALNLGTLYSTFDNLGKCHSHSTYMSSVICICSYSATFMGELYVAFSGCHAVNRIKYITEPHQMSLIRRSTFNLE